MARHPDRINPIRAHDFKSSLAVRVPEPVCVLDGLAVGVVQLMDEYS
jgi:hypothetical protein